MPALQPSASDVHVDAIMTNHSVAYIQQAADFVAAQFAPRVPVQKQSDKYYVFTKAIGSATRRSSAPVLPSQLAQATACLPTRTSVNNSLSTKTSLGTLKRTPTIPWIGAATLPNS